VCMSTRPPKRTLFPYTTLFRSKEPREFPADKSTDHTFDAVILAAAREQENAVFAHTNSFGSADGHIRQGLPPTAAIDLRSERVRSEEHTSELQSRENLVCRLLL